jgi:hypothetical protein
MGAAAEVRGEWLAGRRIDGDSTLARVAAACVLTFWSGTATWEERQNPWPLRSRDCDCACSLASLDHDRF